MNINDDTFDSSRNLAEFRDVMLRGWPAHLQQPARKSVTQGQVEGIKRASRLRASLRAEAKERAAVEAEFLAEGVDQTIRDADDICGAEQNRTKRYGVMSALEATQYFHFQLVMIWNDRSCNPLLADGRPFLKGVGQDLAENRKVILEAIWLARQLADSIAIDYGDFIRAVLADHIVQEKSVKHLRLRAFSSEKAKRAALTWLRTQRA